MIKHRLTLNTGNEIQTFILNYPVRSNILKQFIATVTDEKLMEDVQVESDKYPYLLQKIKSYFSAKGIVLSTKRIDAVKNEYFEQEVNQKEKKAFHEMEEAIKNLMPAID
jgi:hypothetical protein